MVLKRLKTASVLLLLLIISACSENNEAGTDFFEDASLEAVVLEELNMEAEELTEEELASIQILDGYNSSITNLEGIQSLQALENVNFAGNEIEDLSPLASLDQLQNVHVGTVYFTGDENDTNWLLLEELEENGVEVDARARLSFEEHEGPSEGVFYQIEENDRTVYLFGSIHVGDESLYPLHDNIEAAFEDADHLAVEIDISAMNELQASQTIMQYGMYTDGTSLSDVVDEAVFEETVEYLSGFGVPEAMVDQFKPWFVSMMLMEVAMEETSFTGDDGIDMYFIERANEEDMPIISLESLESQIEFLSSSPEEEQVESLEASLDELDIFEEELTQMMRLWQSGDEDVFTMIRNLDEGHEQLSMDDRDLEMANQIEDFLTDSSNDGETYFVVVGALHLVGEASIVGLLEERGFEIEKGIPNE